MFKCIEDSTFVIMMNDFNSNFVFSSKSLFFQFIYKNKQTPSWMRKIVWQTILAPFTNSNIFIGGFETQSKRVFEIYHGNTRNLRYGYSLFSEEKVELEL